MKINLSELITYKTCYCFLKDTSGLDTYHFRKKDYFDKPLQLINTNEIMDALRNCGKEDDNGITEIVTPYGSIMFHIISDYNKIEKFLCDNSRNAPAAYFMNHRTSSCYGFIEAENGNIRRFATTEDGEETLTGEQTECEKRAKVRFREDKMYLVEEDDIVKIAKQFCGFDVENDSVEVLAINRYEYEKYPTEITADVVPLIKENLQQNNLHFAAIYYTLHPSKKFGYIFSMGEITSGKPVGLYAKKLEGCVKPSVLNQEISRVLNVFAYEKLEGIKCDVNAFEGAANLFNHTKGSTKTAIAFYTNSPEFRAVLSWEVKRNFLLFKTTKTHTKDYYSLTQSEVKNLTDFMCSNCS